MSAPVRFAAAAEADLRELLEYIADAATLEVADKDVDELITYCESLAEFPEVGSRRDSVRPGLRVTGFRGRVTIAFATVEGTVVVLGIFYGGRDYEAVLGP